MADLTNEERALLDALKQKASDPNDKELAFAAWQTDHLESGLNEFFGSLIDASTLEDAEDVLFDALGNGYYEIKGVLLVTIEGESHIVDEYFDVDAKVSRTRIRKLDFVK